MSSAIEFRIEWHLAEGIAAPELAATFCRLEFWIGEHCLTRVEDRRGGGVREGIYCSAYSLAEWLATRWWSLRQDVRYSDQNAKRLESLLVGDRLPVNARHDLRGANDGFIWPACTIAPEGKQTLVAWHSRSSDPIAYLSSGAEYLDTDALSEALANFIEAVIARLTDQRVGATLLEEEWGAITGASDDEAAFCNAAAALGLDPYNVDPRVSQLLEQLGSDLGDAVALELAQAADLRKLSEDFYWVRDAEMSFQNRRFGGRELEPLRVAISTATQHPGWPPFRVGWEHAKAARGALGWPVQSRAEVEGLVDMDQQPTSDASLLGAAIVRSDALALRVGAPGESAARFVASRALWRGLHSSSDNPYLITNATTWSHKVERAFAAELLAPAAGISESIGSPRVINSETVQDVASHYAVAPILVRHQLENQLDVVIAD